MNRSQLENLYQVNGLKDFKLKSTKDLLKVHGIDFRAVEGYSRLDDLNRTIYEKFIINIFNAMGLDSRASLVPKGIYWVEDSDYLVKEKPEQDYYTVSYVLNMSMKDVMSGYMLSKKERSGIKG